MDSKTPGVSCALCAIWMVLCFMLSWKSKRKIFRIVLHEDIFFCVLPVLTSWGSYTFSFCGGYVFLTVQKYVSWHCILLVLTNHGKMSCVCRLCILCPNRHCSQRAGVKQPYWLVNITGERKGQCSCIVLC